MIHIEDQINGYWILDIGYSVNPASLVCGCVRLEKTIKLGKEVISE